MQAHRSIRQVLVSPAWPAVSEQRASNCCFKAQAPRRQNKSNHQVFASSPVTDQTVPEGLSAVGHKGLHGFLYGEGGAEAHEEASDNQQIEGEPLPGQRRAIEEYLAKRAGVKASGVYAIISDSGEYQFIGYARSINSAVKVHNSVLGLPKCAFVETRVLPSQAVANRARLQAEAHAWLQELSATPPGNEQEKHLWEAKVVTDIETFEEKKLKLQKAMGEDLVGTSSDPTTEQRRQNLISAISQDDWSSVIDAQTQEVVEGREEAEGPDDGTSRPTSNPITPFSTAHVQEEIGREREAQIMTLESVDMALEEVRPFLIADGGNVEVVDVSNGIVSLRLQGACGTCASSSATMKMGIERALKAAFGEALVEVKQVDAQDTSSSVFSINAHLDMLRPAIKSYGGSVQVKELSNGLCKIDYNGPPTIGSGIIAAIKSQFPDVTDVILK